MKSLWNGYGLTYRGGSGGGDSWIVFKWLEFRLIRGGNGGGVSRPIMTWAKMQFSFCFIQFGGVNGVAGELIVCESLKSDCDSSFDWLLTKSIDGFSFDCDELVFAFNNVNGVSECWNDFFSLIPGDLSVNSGQRRGNFPADLQPRGSMTRERA